MFTLELARCQLDNWLGYLSLIYRTGGDCTKGKQCHPLDSDFFQTFLTCSVTKKTQIKVQYFPVKDTLYPLRV